MGRTCFASTMKFINEMKLNVLDKTPIFEIPLSDEKARDLLIFNQSLEKRFKTTKALQKALVSYP